MNTPSYFLNGFGDVTIEVRSIEEADPSVGVLTDHVCKILVTDKKGNDITDELSDEQYDLLIDVAQEAFRDWQYDEAPEEEDDDAP
jgi:hypothetical protein